MFWDRFYDLCEKNNTKPIPVVKLLGIATGSVTKWKNGTVPNGETLVKISNYFGVSVDYLLGLDSPEKTKPNISAMTAQELNAYIEEQSKNIYDILGSSGKGAANVEIPPEAIEKLTKANEKTFCLFGDDKCTEISESEYKKLLKVLDAIRM